MAEPIVAVVPAAGIGTRLGAALPKQYLELAGTSILQRSIDTILSVDDIDELIVVLAGNDQWFDQQAAAKEPRVHRVVGGTTRAASVAAGVQAVRQRHGEQAWALVHDAARPLVDPVDIDRLIAAVRQANTGGILASPVTDTIKRATQSVWIEDTVPREALWRALTPQMFRAGELGAALQQAVDTDSLGSITDESSAMERAGHASQLVAAQRWNPKITHADDIQLAEAWLTAQLRGPDGAHR